MHAGAAQVTVSSAAVRGRARRARVDIDGRSAAAKRVNKLAALFVAELGGPDAVSPTTMLKVRRAAELVVTAEEMRASTLSAEHPPTDLAMLALVRLEGIADRAVRRLGLGLDCKPKTAEPTLAQYLATRQPAAEQLEEAGTTATESDSSAPSANDVGEHGAPE